VEFEDGLPISIMSDVEKVMLNGTKKSFQAANVHGAIPL
jgi:hypothetical protein